MPTETTLPQYKATKFVSAFKIGALGITEQRFGAPWRLMPENVNLSPVEVSGDFMQIYQPEVGGYYMLDGDQPCYKPAAAFEREYTPA